MKRKKKLAFVLTTFVVGGVEKSVLDLLEKIDRERYDVLAFLPDDEGEWTALLKEKCEVRYLRNEDYKTVILSQFRKGDVFGAIRSLFFRVLARLNYKSHYRKSTEYFIRSMPRIRERFDCVVAYQIINDDCVLGALYRLNARKKIVWSHAYIRKNEPIYGEWYNQFHKIFCVSEFAKKALTDNFPGLTEKTEVFHNLVNRETILCLSQDPAYGMTYDGMRLVTVGRLSKEKGQIIIPAVAHLLEDRGYSFKWYLVGDGDLREELETMIRKEGQEERVILLGNRNNPYPYIKACDIYVQTSLTEGWGLTVSEAKILQKPIVTTDAGVMSEQISNGLNGIVVPLPEAEILAEEIGRLIDCPEMRDAFAKQLCLEYTHATGELDKLYAVIEH